MAEVRRPFTILENNTKREFSSSSGPCVSRTRVLYVCPRAHAPIVVGSTNKGATRGVGPHSPTSVGLLR